MVTSTVATAATAAAKGACVMDLCLSVLHAQTRTYTPTIDV